MTIPQSFTEAFTRVRELVDIFKENESAYDPEGDTLYINFKKPSQATDSNLTDDDVIVRYENGEIVGLTILHASKR